jgi:hypothetical protein
MKFLLLVVFAGLLYGSRDRGAFFHWECPHARNSMRCICKGRCCPYPTIRSHTEHLHKNHAASFRARRFGMHMDLFVAIAATHFKSSCFYVHGRCAYAAERMRTVLDEKLALRSGGSPVQPPGEHNASNRRAPSLSLSISIVYTHTNYDSVFPFN